MGRSDKNIVSLSVAAELNSVSEMHILFVKPPLLNLTNLHWVDCVELTLQVANALLICIEKVSLVE